MTREAAILGAMIGAMACSPTSPADTGFPLAYFHGDCAPWDGPALTIVLTHTEMENAFDADYPFVRVTLYRPPARLAGSTVTWTGNAQSDGYATLCESADACANAVSVRVAFDRSQDDADILRGDVQVALEGGREITGRFEAHRIDFQALCG